MRSWYSLQFSSSDYTDYASPSVRVPDFHIPSCGCPSVPMISSFLLAMLFVRNIEHGRSKGIIENSGKLGD